MFRSLYLSRPWVSCFEGEGGAGDGAATGAGASAGALRGRRTAGAAAGAAAAGGETRFTQEDLNRFLAEDRRKHQVQLQKMESQAQRAGEEQEPDGAGAPDVEGEPGHHRRSVADGRAAIDLGEAAVGGAVPDQDRGIREEGTDLGSPVPGLHHRPLAARRRREARGVQSRADRHATAALDASDRGHGRQDRQRPTGKYKPDGGHARRGCDDRRASDDEPYRPRRR